MENIHPPRKFPRLRHVLTCYELHATLSHQLNIKIQWEWTSGDRTWWCIDKLTLTASSLHYHTQHNYVEPNFIMKMQQQTILSNCCNIHWMRPKHCKVRTWLQYHTKKEPWVIVKLRTSVWLPVSWYAWLLHMIWPKKEGYNKGVRKNCDGNRSILSSHFSRQ